MKVLGSRAACAGTPTTPSSSGRRRPAAARRRSSSCGTGLKAVPAYDADDDDATAPRACARWTRRSTRPTPSCSPRPSTTTRSRARSRTRSTGSRGRSPTSPLRNKPVAVVGASTGLFGAVWAQAELRKVLGAIGARVVDRELPVGLAADAFADDGRLADHDLELILARPARRAARRGARARAIAA